MPLRFPHREGIFLVEQKVEQEMNRSEAGRRKECRKNGRSELLRTVTTIKKGTRVSLKTRINTDIVSIA